jgi:hypothetical protein
MSGGCAIYLKNGTDCWIDFLPLRLWGQKKVMTMGKADVKKEGWSATELGEQSSYEGTTEISRRLRRGDETVGDADQRDVAGVIPEDDTPHGREARDVPRKSPRKDRTRVALRKSDKK